MAHPEDESDGWEADLAEADQPWNDEDPDDLDEDERAWCADDDGYGEGGTVILNGDGYGESGTVIFDEGREDDGGR